MSLSSSHLYVHIFSITLYRTVLRHTYILYTEPLIMYICIYVSHLLIYRIVYLLMHRYNNSSDQHGYRKLAFTVQSEYD